ncbi:NUDIX hydrolase [Candidatus Uhrbacteria bacterium]|nr:NUDIX hydrolase [Candidatus Uhrbacteria bacterium]
MQTNFEYFMISQVGIWIRDGKMLLLEDAAHPGKYVIPGGRIDKGEDSQKAFRREMKEEVNLDAFEVGPIVDVRVWYSGEKQTPYCAIVRLIRTETEQITLSAEHLSARWVNEDELSEILFVWEFGEDICRAGFKVFRNQYV